MTYNNKKQIEELRKKMVDITSTMFDAQIELSEHLLAIFAQEFVDIVQKNKRDIENYIDGKILPF
jgi:hypothetical protein